VRLFAVGDDFSGIQDVFRIERRLDAAHERTDLPYEPHDILLDRVVTPERF